MPNEQSHLSLANHNQDLLDKLLGDVGEFPDWVATVAFYKALHVVEAALACENPPRHGVDHSIRERMLKSDKRYESIWHHYRPLMAASMVARYMKDEQANFASYMAPVQVVDILLKYRLHEIEKSALKKIRNPNRLATIATHLASKSSVEAEPVPKPQV